jgi:F-type H+-transporting ATPase subunit gamma
MSAVEICQFEDAVASLHDYFDTIEKGMQVLLRKAYEENPALPETNSSELEGWIILGSGQALCGSFDTVIAHYSNQMKTESTMSDLSVYCCGERLSDLLKNQDVKIDRTFRVPGSVAAINGSVLDLILGIEKWQTEKSIQCIRVFHNKSVPKKGFIPGSQIILPPNEVWLNSMKKKTWPSRTIPQFKDDPGTLFRNLLRQYLFVSLYQAFAESLAAEYGSRLSAMQRAEQKIDERLGQLQQEYTSERQSMINEELLDIQAGFEAILSREQGDKTT